MWLVAVGRHRSGTGNTLASKKNAVKGVGVAAKPKSKRLLFHFVGKMSDERILRVKTNVCLVQLLGFGRFHVGLGETRDLPAVYNR